jgi:mRNA interferase MazF
VQLNRGAVVIASIGDPSGKPRPFLVLRSNHFAEHSLVTLLAFTGTVTEAPTLRVPVQPSIENGLREPSQVMIDHIQSVRVQRISEVIGQLAETDLRAVTRGVTIYLGIADPTRRRLRRVPRGPKRRKRARPHVA